MMLASDPVLFAAIQKFSEKELAERPNFINYRKSWAAIRLDAEGRLEEVVGLAGYRTVPDIALFRSIDRGATVKLAQRINDHFSDSGMRGGEAFLHIAPEDKPEQRCSLFQSTMDFWSATPSNRMIVVAR